MRWNADNWIMTLEFEKATNAPPINDVRDFDRLISTNTTGSHPQPWESNGQHLAIHINAPNDADAVQEAFDARSFWAACAPWPPCTTSARLAWSCR